MVALFLAAGMLAGTAVYGADTPPTPYGALPLWGAIYSCTVWPVLWGLTEQLTNLCYALPCLHVLSGRTWAAVAVVCVGWCAQHLALPFIMDGQWLACRFVSVIPIATVLRLIYLRTRRLLPLVIAHAIIDAAGTLTFVVLAAPRWRPVPGDFWPAPGRRAHRHPNGQCHARRTRHSASAVARPARLSVPDPIWPICRALQARFGL